MKLSAISTALVVALSAAAAAPAMAADGTVTINGQITATTCNIDAGGTGTKNQTVTLPTVSTTALDAANKPAGETNFYFNLSGTGCAGTAKMHFESASSPVNVATNRLRNETLPAAGGADFVEVAILNKDGSKIQLSDSSNSASYTLTAGATTRLDYFARYEATTAAATAGEVKTHVDYSIDYN